MNLQIWNSFIGHTSMNQLTKSLVNLKSLKITSSRFEQMYQESLSWNLKTLEKIELTNNKLKNLSESFFILMPNLKIINLSGNYLTNLEEGLFRNQKMLKSLDLSKNKLNERLKPDVFYNLPSSLKELNIHGNSLRH